MSDEKTRIVPAKVHGDSGVTAVVAETSGSERENGETADDTPAVEDETAPAAQTTEAGMRS